MAIVHIKDVADLEAGDKVIFAPFGVPMFENSKTEISVKDGLVGFLYGRNDDFFPVITPEGKIIDNLVLVEATRDVVVFEAEENIGKEIFIGNDLPELYGVRVIVRHPKYGDYRGFASNDNIEGYETIRLIDNIGHGSFQFWRSGNFKIYLAVGLDFEYESLK